MATTRTLGSVNLLSSVYQVMRSTEGGVPSYEETWERERNGTAILLGQFCKATQPFSFDIEVEGRTGGWQAALTAIAAIQTELNLAAAYSIAGTGTQIVYTEQFGNQSVASTWNVKFGKVWEIRSERLIDRAYTRIHVEFMCEPGAVA